MTADDVRRLLQRACDKAGSARLWADAAGCSQQYVTDVLKGRREPSAAVLAPLGLERRVEYVRIKRG